MTNKQKTEQRRKDAKEFLMKCRGLPNAKSDRVVKLFELFQASNSYKEQAEIAEAISEIVIPETTNKLVFLSSGQDSDYTVHGVYQVNTDWGWDKLHELFLKYVKPTDVNYLYFKEFIHWMEYQGFIAPVDFTEVHLGRYGKFEITEQGSCDDKI